MELLSREIRKRFTFSRIMPLISNIQFFFKNGALTLICCFYNHLIIPHYNGSNKEISITNTYGAFQVPGIYSQLSSYCLIQLSKSFYYCLCCAKEEMGYRKDRTCPGSHNQLLGWFLNTAFQSGVDVQVNIVKMIHNFQQLTRRG